MGVPAHAETLHPGIDDGAGFLAAITAANANDDDVIEFDVAIATVISYMGTATVAADGGHRVTLRLAEGSAPVIIRSLDDTAIEVQSGGHLVVEGTLDGGGTGITVQGVDGQGISGTNATIEVVDTSLDGTTGNGLDTGNGVRLDGGSFTMTGGTANENDADGILLTGNLTTVAITDVATEQNDRRGVSMGSGTAVSVTVTRLTSTGNGADGLGIFAPGGSTVQVIGPTLLSENGVDGGFVNADDTNVTVSGLDAIGNGEDGFGVSVGDGSVVTITDLEARENGQSGLTLVAASGSAIMVTGADIVDNTAAGPAAFGGGIWGEFDSGSSLTLTRARVEGHAAASGGGIALDEISGGAVVSIIDSDISGNEADGDGGGIAIPQVRGSSSALAIIDSRITGNTSQAGNGGGVWIGSLGIADDDPAIGGLTILRSTFDANETHGALPSGDGAGLYIGSIVGAGPDDPVVEVDRTTFSRNTASGVGSAINITATPETDRSQLVRITTSTFAENHAERGATIALDGAQGPDDEPLDVEISHSTISANTIGGAASLGGLGVQDRAQLRIHHTILSGNQDYDLIVGQGVAKEYAYNLFGVIDPDSETDYGAGPGNLPLGTPADLEPLADNGGPNETMLPAEGSAAIDAGNAAIADAPPTDQRGDVRIRNGRIDIGAVEVQPVLSSTGGTVAGWLVWLVVGLAAAGAALLAVRTALRHRA